MRRSSLTMLGDLANEAGSPAWSSTTSTDDTLTLSPATGWSAGEARTIEIGATDVAGNAMQRLQLRYEVVAGTLLYARADALDDSGDGLSPAAAKKTIQAAISAAGAPAAVLVAEGDYPPPGSSPVALAAGVSLYGGFDSAFTSRDPAARPTRILGAGLSEGTAVTAYAAMGSDTVFDGFVVVGGDSTANALAMALVSQAELSVRNNIIVAGDGPSTGYFFSTALGVPGSARITGNVIRGGHTTYSTGLVLSGGSPFVANNVMRGGAGTFSYGMRLQGGTPVVVNNTIDGGSGSLYSTGIDLVGDVKPVIENNLVYTTAAASGRLCIGEGNDLPLVVSLKNNDLFDCPSGLYSEQVAGTSGNCSFNTSFACQTSIDEVNDAQIIGASASSGNVSIDPAFLDRAGGDLHLTASSPASVTAGALQRDDVTYDKDGARRTVPWSMGAYERD
jgi:hypothetical protein